MKRLTLLLLAALIFAGAGHTAQDESESPSAKTTPQANNYHTLNPLIITIIKAGKVYGYLRLEIQLATKDDTPIAPYQPLFPLLIDAYTASLYSLICDRWIPDQPLNPDTILKIIQELTDKVTKERVQNDNLKAYLKGFFLAPANK